MVFESSGRKLRTRSVVTPVAVSRLAETMEL
jgi:hypothetical protein